LDIFVGIINAFVLNLVDWFNDAYVQGFFYTPQGGRSWTDTVPRQHRAFIE